MHRRNSTLLLATTLLLLAPYAAGAYEWNDYTGPGTPLFGEGATWSLALRDGDAVTITLRSDSIGDLDVWVVPPTGPGEDPVARIASDPGGTANDRAASATCAWTPFAEGSTWLDSNEDVAFVAPASGTYELGLKNEFGTRIDYELRIEVDRRGVDVSHSVVHFDGYVNWINVAPQCWVL